MNSKAHRDSIFVEDAEILSHEAYPGNQFVMRVKAPKCATRALPGQFAHLTVDPQRPLRRPISIMRVSSNEGWVDFLYKAVGEGTKLLSQRKAGELISILGPIGKPFELSARRPLLIGGGVGMPPMLFAAESIKGQPDKLPMVILGSEVPFPFQPVPSQFLLPGVPADVIAAMPLLEDWGIPSRLTSLQGYAGCLQGYVTDLARYWLDSLDDAARKEICLYACGPQQMLRAVVNLAREYGLPSQVSLEEHMACGVGGCAGCAVEIKTDQGKKMKRICVDGPVFSGEAVF